MVPSELADSRQEIFERPAVYEHLDLWERRIG